MPCSQGLAAYVLATNPSATSQGIVIGHDHRHNSHRFALLTASVFLSRGIRVYLYSGLVHTPMVPFGVTTLGAAVGVMITASHNPKNDNGYKVYWGNGVQIIAPHDTGIAKAIEENLEPKVGKWEEAVESVRGNELCVDRTEEMKRLYHEHVKGLSRTRGTNRETPVRIVYTAMHGVGTPFLLEAFETFDFPKPDLCKEQCEPDPEFPTVPFPNPEEKGALVSRSSISPALWDSPLILPLFRVVCFRTWRWPTRPRRARRSCLRTIRTRTGSPLLSETGTSPSVPSLA